MNLINRAIISWFCPKHQSLSRLKAPRIRPAIEHLEGRLNPAPVASLPQLLDIPHSLVVLSPDIASQVPVAEYAGARVLTLDPTRDVISQISASLAGQLSVTSLRVIGHGQPGSLSLAGQTINLATLQTRSVEVAGWASHLTPDADILLYGCSVASTDGGRAFVNTLATLTGVDVAASSDATGAGGNLTLEYTAGAVTDHLQASPQAWNKSGLQLPTEGDYNYELNTGGTSVTITGYTGIGGTVTISDTLVGLPVTGIAFQAFAFNTSLTSVTIPNSVTSIGQEAFYRCDNLTAIAVDVANYNFSSRDGILFNKAQTDLIQCPGGKAGPVTIPASVTSIGNESFAYCSSLTSVTIPSSVTSIGDQALRDCSSLTRVTMPSSVTFIGENAVAFCGSLTAIEVDAANNDFSSRGGILFNKAQTLLIQYPGGKAGPYTIPESVISIRDWAFSYCSSLTSVIIPLSVTSVGDWAFDSCGGLTTVTLPESIVSIGNGAFAYCLGMTRINSLGNAPALGGSNVFDMVPATLYYISGTTGWTNPWGGLPTVESSPVAAPFSLAAGSLVASLGNGQMGIWSATGDYQAISPFPGYTGPLNVNTVNRADGQNADSIVVAVAGRGSPHVLTIDSATGRVTSSFYAFAPGFLGGVTVAGGVTRIGGEITAVILCGAGSGSSPSVSVFNAVTSQPMGAFYAYSNQYLGGVRVALSEAGADGTSFAIIGSNITSHVVAFDLNDYYNPIMSFNAFPDNLTPQGIYVASGDLDDDGLNEIVVGAGQGSASPQVAVFDFVGRLKKSFNAFDLSFLGGVQVGVADFNKDGKLDILAASGVGVPGTLNVFNYDNLALLDTLFISDSTLGFDVASNFSRG